MSNVPAAGACHIAVNANSLNPLLGYSHLYIVFTDATGKKQYFRGGPSAGGPGGSSGLSGQLSGGSSNNSSHGSSGSGSNSSAGGATGGPYGDIETDTGDYEPGSIDWNPDARSIEVASGVEACAKLDQLKEQMTLIQNSHTPYNPLGPNSNSTVFTALRNVGIPPKVPDGVWAPGKDLPIPVTAPPSQKLNSATMCCPDSH